MCSKISRSRVRKRTLRALTDRAPRLARRQADSPHRGCSGQRRCHRRPTLGAANEVVPVDDIIAVDSALIDESALTGEPIPVVRSRGARVYSGSLNAGNAFEMTASSLAGESTYAGILRLVTAAQTAKPPFVRLADRYALVLLLDEANPHQ